MIISHQNGRGKKIHILIDDEYQITTDVDFWSQNYINDGTDIDEEQWQELVDAINYSKAVNKCYDLLSRRDHSVKELRQKLLRTVDPDNADKAIEKMLDLGYLDDEKYARTLFRHLYDNKKMSLNFIKREMYMKGIDSFIIEDVLCENEVDNVANIVELINSKYAGKLQGENGKQKVMASLARKGFSYSDIKSAFYRIENEDYV